MKTKIITIPDQIVSTVLASLHEKNITCEYMGLDSKKNLIMELTFQDASEKQVEHIVQFIKDKEASFEELMEAIGKVMPKMTGDQIIGYGELKNHVSTFLKIFKNE